MDAPRAQSQVECVRILGKSRTQFIEAIVLGPFHSAILACMPSANNVRAASIRTLSASYPDRAANELLDLVISQQLWKEFIPALENVGIKLSSLFIGIQCENIPVVNLLNEYGKKQVIPRQAPPLPSHYVPRTEPLEQLRKLLLPSTENRVLVIKAISGLGGLGKSTLAAAFAHETEQQFPDGTLWVTLGQQPNILTLLNAWILSLSNTKDAVQFSDKQAASNHLRSLLSAKKALLIIDDVWSSDDLSYFLVGGNACRTLVTTRETHLPDFANNLYDLPVMSESEALTLCEKLLTTPISLEHRQYAIDIVKEVGYLPLAIELAIAQIRTNAYTWQALLLRLKNEIERLIALDRSRFIRKEEDKKKYSVDASLSISLETLEDEDRKRFALLGILYPRATITAEVCELLWNTNKENTQILLSFLQQKSLLMKIPRKEARYQLHDLLQSKAMNLLLPKPLKEFHQSLINNYKSKLAKSDDITSGPLDPCGYLLEKLEWHYKEVGNTPPNPFFTPNQCNTADDYLRTIKWGIAGICAMPREDLRLLFILDTLVDEYSKRSTGLNFDFLYSAMEHNPPLDVRRVASMPRVCSKLCDRVLSGDAEVFRLLSRQGRANDPSFFASIFHQQGKNAQAETFYRLCLDQCQKILGVNHPGTLSIMNDLANTLNDLAKYIEAEQVLRKVLAERIRVLGKDHPDTLASMNNLSTSLQQQARYSEAEQLLRYVLEKRERILGGDHYHTLSAMNNLAVLLSNQGKFLEAEELNRRALEIRKRVLGENHPYTLTSMNNLADTLRDQHKYEEAEFIYLQLEQHIQVLGEDHPHTLSWMTNYALTLLELGKCDQAVQLFKKLLEKSRKTLGMDHPNTVSIIHNLAKCLEQQSRYSDAEYLLREAVEKSQTTLGEDNPGTLSSMESLGVVLGYQGKYTEAEMLHRQVLEGRKKILGEDHPSTLTSRNNLRETLRRQGKYSEMHNLDRSYIAHNINGIIATSF